MLSENRVGSFRNTLIHNNIIVIINFVIMNESSNIFTVVLNSTMNVQYTCSHTCSGKYVQNKKTID